MTTPAKITGLTYSNVQALNELADELPTLVTVTATTATFTDAGAGAHDVGALIGRLPGRGHPKASLHAVRRKLAAADTVEAFVPDTFSVNVETDPDYIVEDEFA